MQYFVAKLSRTLKIKQCKVCKLSKLASKHEKKLKLCEKYNNILQLKGIYACSTQIQLVQADYVLTVYCKHLICPSEFTFFYSFHNNENEHPRVVKI